MRERRGIYTGKITRMKGDNPFVKIPRVGGDYEFGPLDILEGPWTESLFTKTDGNHSHENSAVASAGNHAHAATGNHSHTGTTGFTGEINIGDNSYNSHVHSISTDANHQHAATGDHTHGLDIPANSGGHAHAVRKPLKPGDKVLVAFTEGRPDDPVVLGRLT